MARRSPTAYCHRCSRALVNTAGQALSGGSAAAHSSTARQASESNCEVTAVSAVARQKRVADTESVNAKVASKGVSPGLVSLRLLQRH